MSAIAVPAVVFSEHGSPVLPVAACMAANLPIIASRTAELGEFLQDKDTASIQEDSNPRDVAQRTLNLSNNSSLRERLVKGARKEVANRFAPDRFIADWRTVYNGVPPPHTDYSIVLPSGVAESYTNTCHWTLVESANYALPCSAGLPGRVPPLSATPQAFSFSLHQ